MKLQKYVTLVALLGFLGLVGPAMLHAQVQIDRCPEGFFDRRNGGECWKCPPGFARTGAAVDSGKACQRVEHSSATFLSKSVLAEETTRTAIYQGGFSCPAKFPGAFQDPRNGGECWRCPNGFQRTVFAVNANNACEKGGPFGQHAKADFKGKPGCPSGTFRNGLLDRCYSCPTGFHRSTHMGEDLTKVADACVR